MQEKAGLPEALDLMKDLRRRCEWDAAQTHESLRPYLIEEAYEVDDAIRSGDDLQLKGELGDLLLQVVFHARMAQESGAFDFSDVVAAISDKMTRRHPHVFAHAVVADAATQSRAWDMHKRAERDAAGDSDASVLAGISRGLPEWQRALKLQQRAARVGFDWPDPAPVIEKLHEEIEEVRIEFAAVSDMPGDLDAHARLEDEIGDLLFVCANLARHANVDPGNALRRANRKFERRFRAMEALAIRDGVELGALSLDAQDRYWNQAKKEENKDS